MCGGGRGAGPLWIQNTKCCAPNTADASKTAVRLAEKGENKSVLDGRRCLPGECGGVTQAGLTLRGGDCQR